MAGRPLVASAPPRELAPCDPKTVAPLNDDGFPDMMNYMPTRLVPLDEAKQRGWPLFYQAEVCRYGHAAPRYVSNPRQCVDCFRIKRGKQPLSAAPVTASAEYKRTYKQRDPVPAPSSAVTTPSAAGPEPDRLEKKFLAYYAEKQDLDVAAVMAGLTAAQVIARMSWSKTFADAVKLLEDRLSLTHIAVASGPFEWTPEKLARLIEVLVDTGDIATARDSIRVTPSEYFRELERNPDFAVAIEEAMPLANKALEERAVQLALAGNDKLLQKTLAAKFPEYRERLNVDMNVTEKLTDDQLNSQLSRLVGKYRGRVIDAEFRDVEPPRSLAAPDHVEGDRAARETELNSDLL